MYFILFISLCHSSHKHVALQFTHASSERVRACAYKHTFTQKVCFSFVVWPKDNEILKIFTHFVTAKVMRRHITNEAKTIRFSLNTSNRIWQKESNGSSGEYQCYGLCYANYFYLEIRLEIPRNLFVAANY